MPDARGNSLALMAAVEVRLTAGGRWPTSNLLVDRRLDDVGCGRVPQSPLPSCTTGLFWWKELSLGVVCVGLTKSGAGLSLGHK